MRIILAILFAAYMLITHDTLRKIVYFPVKVVFALIGVVNIVFLLEIMLAVFGW